MVNTSTQDPIAQLVAKYQTNSHQMVSTEPQPAPHPQQVNDWTGFVGKTLWDWLNLSGVFLIPVVIAAASILLTVQQSVTSLQLNEKQHQGDQAIALDQQRATILKAYMDDMTELLMHEGLRESKTDTSVRIVARAKTLVVLSQLDGARKRTLVRFLYEAQLISCFDIRDCIISLMAADLRETDLHEAALSQANLSWTDMSGANMSGANVSQANLHKANLRKANLRKANLGAFNDNGTVLWSYAHEPERGADLSQADLSQADLSQADLSLADLGGANLSGAKVTPEELAKAYRLKNATLPDGSHYPSGSYPIRNHQEPTDQTSLERWCLRYGAC